MDRFEFATKRGAMMGSGNRRHVCDGLRKVLKEQLDANPSQDLFMLLTTMVDLIAAIDGDQSGYKMAQSLR